MSTRKRVCLPFLPGILVTLLVTSIFSSCSGSSKLRKLLPDCLPTELTDLLEEPDDAGLREYALENGMTPLTDLLGYFQEAYDCRTPEQFLKSEQVLQKPHERVAVVLADEFGQTYYLNMLHAVTSHDAADRREIRRLLKLCRSATTSPQPAEQIKQLREAVSHFKHVGFEQGTAIAMDTLAELYVRTGDARRSESCGREALEDFRRLDYPRLTCQVLGSMGSVYLGRGQVDSMHVCWDEALRIAVSNRLPDQAPRILNFYARLYQRQGRVALAHEMLQASLELSNQYQAGDVSTRFVIELAEFYAHFGYWTLADRLLDRASVIARGNPCHVYSLFLRATLEARVLMARGGLDEADRAYREARTLLGASPHPDDKARLYWFWAEGLIARGDPARALVLADEALQLPSSIPDRLWLTKAEAALQTGDLQTSSDALDHFAATLSAGEALHGNEWITHDALRVDLALARGDTTSAWNAAAVGLARLERYFAATDASADGYIVAARAQRLRASLLHLVRDQPELGLGVSLHWIELFRSLGTRPAGASGTASENPETVRQKIAAAATGTIASVRRLGACHLTYAVAGNQVWRWTVTRDGVRQDVLPQDSDSLRALVAEASALVSARTAQPKRPARVVLGELSDVLLPDILRTNPADTSTVLVTADDYLGAFPFETLDVDPDGYVPLLMRHDVAYLRPNGSGMYHAPTGNNIVFLSPSTASDLQSYGFQPSLRAAPVEASVAASLVPHSRVFSGPKATKRALTAGWEQSELIYIIGHMIHDPDVPYFVLLPTAPSSPGATIENRYLDVSDVRSANLARCSLVVLSGCSSGLPYTREGVVAPSFAHVFIDAGARAVVHTFWDIDDQVACDLMANFIRRRESGVSTVRALADARRAAISANKWAPFDWSSYGVTIGSVELLAQ